MLMLGPAYEAASGPPGLNWIVADGTDYALIAMTALGPLAPDGTTFSYKIRLRTATAFPGGNLYLCGWSRGNIRIATGNLALTIKDTANTNLVDAATVADIPTGDVLVEIDVDTVTPAVTIKFNGTTQTLTTTTLLAGTMDFNSGSDFGILATQAGATILNNCDWSDLHIAWNGTELVTATENAAGLNASFNEAVGGPAATITGTFADA